MNSTGTQHTVRVIGVFEFTGVKLVQWHENSTSTQNTVRVINVFEFTGVKLVQWHENSTSTQNTVRVIGVRFSIIRSILLYIVSAILG